MPPIVITELLGRGQNFPVPTKKKNETQDRVEKETVLDPAAGREMGSKGEPEHKLGIPPERNPHASVLGVPSTSGRILIEGGIDRD